MNPVLNIFQTMAVFLLSICFLTVSIAAEVPDFVQYDGVLTDATSAIVPDGNHDITFGLYPAASGGTAVWTESWTVATSQVSTKNGVFSVLLGTHSPLSPDVFQQHGQLYLGVMVGDDAEMVPRHQVASVPYAMSAAGDVPTGAIIMWSGQIGDIPSGWALCDGQNGTPDLRNRFLAGAGSTYAVGATGGSATHTLSATEIPPHSHSVNPPATSTNTTGAHTHDLSLRMSNDSSTSSAFREGKSIVTRTYPTNSAGDHAHSVDIPVFDSSSVGSGQPHNNLPPYYALGFIMKL